MQSDQAPFIIDCFRIVGQFKAAKQKVESNNNVAPNFWKWLLAITQYDQLIGGKEKTEMIGDRSQSTCRIPGFEGPDADTGRPRIRRKSHAQELFAMHKDFVKAFDNIGLCLRSNNPAPVLD